MRMGQNKINQRNLIIVVIILCVLLCIILTTSFRLSATITNSLRESAYDSLMNASEIIRQNLDSTMQADIDLLDSFGTILKSTQFHDVARQLSQLCEVNGLRHAYYVDSTGTGISETGDAFYASQLAVPETALSGVSSVSSGFVGETGQQHICIQAPVYDDTGIVGALYAEAVATRYYAEEVFIFHNGNGRASLFDRTNGAFVIKAPQNELLSLKSDNIFDAVLKSNNDSSIYNTFVEKLAAGDKSILPMQFGDIDSYVAILPCKTNSDLYVATIISQQALQAEVDSISRLILFMQCILIVGLGGLIVIGALLFYKNSKDRQVRELQELELKYEQRSREELSAALIKAQEANIAKTQFLSNMSHDMRTPMNAIIGMTAIACQNIGNEEEMRDCLRVIASSSHHLLGLINDILDMSKIESGNLTLENEPFALPIAVNGVASIIAPQCIAKGQKFSTEFIRIKHEYLMGDKTKFNQVLINLLNNASKFTPTGGNIALSVEELPSNDDTAAVYRIMVKDDGIGIAKDQQDAIFDAFVRAGDATVTRAEGTGLGLSIAKNIVQAMGGSLDLDSELGAGTTFTATLRFPIQQRPDFSGDYRELDGIPALVVANESDVCKRICDYLRDVGMAADFAATGQDAVLKLMHAHGDSQDYRMVLADWNMPNEDSADMLRRIRLAGGLSLTVIVMTSGSNSSIENAAHEAGANACLPKPLFRSSLYEKLSQINKSNSLYQKPPLILLDKRILVVEDNPINQAVAQRILENVGASVDVTDNGREGVDAFLASPKAYYDAILMDIRMPVMNGYDAVKQIRGSAHPDAARIPIIAISANAYAEDVKRASESGMNDFLTKPIEPRVLYTMLHNLFVDGS